MFSEGLHQGAPPALKECVRVAMWFKKPQMQLNEQLLQTTAFTHTYSMKQLMHTTFTLFLLRHVVLLILKNGLQDKQMLLTGKDAAQYF